MADAAPSHAFLPQLAAGAGEFAIEGPEAHYLARVVRVRPGDRVSATDGRGALAELEILAVHPGVRAACRAFEQRTPARRLEIWCGAPEGDRADWLIEKLGELGAARFRPLDTARVRWQTAGRRQERWERLAVAALRQSRSRELLSIDPPATLDDCLGELPGAGQRLVADPDGGPASRFAAGEGPTVVAIGPSSGFSPEELNRLRDKGFEPLRLAASRLRTETAALAAAAWWAAGA